MKKQVCIVLAILLPAAGMQAIAQEREDESLKMTALEALMSAPPDRALPIVEKVLKGDGSVQLKRRALFVLGQIDDPAALEILVATARSGEPALRREAIRAIGISGDMDAIAALADVYAGSDEEDRKAILEAFLIADYAQGAYEIALRTDDPVEFERAVESLAAMGATEELRSLRERADMAEYLIDAYAIAGDVESLAILARNTDNPQQQIRAIHGLGVAGEGEVGVLLVDIYRGTDSAEVRAAVRNAFLIYGEAEPLLELYRATTDRDEKRELLQTLVHMDSEAVWDVVEQTLEEDE